MFKVTDLFCGCGGSSTGAAAVPGIELTHAFNHWERAVESHAANHPTVDTALTDLFEVHPAAFPRMDILLGSPECRTHSPAAGTRRKNVGQIDLFDRCDLSPEKIKSRATMWTMVHWASVHRPLFVIVENVVEIHYWPELQSWFREMENLGYDYQCVYVNAMHVHGLLDERIRFMAPQSRDRIYIVFWRKGAPAPDLSIRPPAPCPSCAREVRAVQSWKNTKLGRQRWGKYGRQYVYRCPECGSEVEPYTFAAANAIDWSIEGIRIGEREEHGLPPLSEKTIARIRYGLKKFGLRPYQVSFRGSQPAPSLTRGIDEPLPSQTTIPNTYLARPGITVDLARPGHAGKSHPVDEPLATQTTRQTLSLVFANRTNGLPRSAKEPLHTVTTGSTLGLLTALRTNGKAEPVELTPMPTVTAGGTHHGLVTTHRGESKSHPTDQPLTAVTAGAINHGLVTSPAAQVTLRGTRSLDGLDEPLGVVTTAQQIGILSRNPFLVQYYGSLNASDVGEPMPVVTTKDRHGLVEGDSCDVDELCFRMLEPEELKVGTDHPARYVLVGTKRDRVKLVGNSNYPGIEQLLVARCIETLQ